MESDTKAECMRHGLSILLITSTVNKILTHYDSMNVKMDVKLFLSHLQSLIASYKQVFGRPSAVDVIKTVEDLTKHIESSQLSEFLILEGDSLHIKADSLEYSTQMKDLILQSGRRYSEFLLKNVNDLAKLYENVRKTQEAETKAQSQAQAKEKEANKKQEPEPEPEQEREPEPEKKPEASSESEESEESEEEQVQPKQSPAKIEKKQETEESSEESVMESESEPEPEPEKTKQKEVSDKPETSEPETSDSSASSDSDSSDEEESKKEETKKIRPKEESEDVSTPRRSSRKRSASPALTPGHNQKRFQSIAISLINNIQSHRFSSVFLQPVNKKEIPEYYDVVYEPRDLKSMMKEVKSKTSNPRYTSLQQLERDILLMFANCIVFNHSDEHLVSLARTMRDDVVSSFNLFRDAEQ